MAINKERICFIIGQGTSINAHRSFKYSSDEVAFKIKLNHWDFYKIIRAESGFRFYGENSVQNFATAFKAFQAQSAGVFFFFFNIKSFSVILCKDQKTILFFTQSNLKIFGLCMFNCVMNDLLQH